MRAYTSTYLACWLVSVLGCSSELGPVPYTDPTLHDEQHADAGPTNCDLEGTWDLTLSTRDVCSPTDAGAAVSVTVDNSGTDSDDFVSAEAVPESPCGSYKREVNVAADGCTITASSLASWCVDDRPQCSDYKLTLHVHNDGKADVIGTYRSCWCGSPSAFGTKVQVAGSAVRR